jgi:ATP-dependent exoDNAse (exonuclease V) alpha subunit
MKLTDNRLQNLLMNEWAMKRINEPDVLIIDEVSMLSSNFINTLNALLKRLRGDEKPFGGMQVIFVGDFFQLPPVSRNEHVEFAFKARAWEDAGLSYCYLTEQHRQSDPMFLEILTAMRSGTITEDHKKVLRACQLTEEPDVHLFTHNADVDLMNNAELEKLDSSEYTFMARYEGDKYAIESLKKYCLSPEVLKLKEGAVVMFTRNKKVDDEMMWVNGTVGTVIRFEDGMPVVQVNDTGEILYPDRMDWEMEENGRVRASMRQIPLRLAWAITVHKSQGMSLDCASIDLSRTFEFGQGYVAISRVRSLKGLHLEGLNAKAFAMHPDVVERDAWFRNQSEKL